MNMDDFHAEAERTILVWNTPHVVRVYQKSKSVWIAVGDYMGKQIEIKGGNRSFVLARWKEAARDRGNP